LKNIAVVILNFNGKHFLEKFLQNTLDNSPEAEVVVIDNASTDASAEYLKTAFPGVPLVLLDKNYGFAEGYNRGLATLTHDYFILLNSDVEVTRGWILPLLQVSLARRDVAAVQPKILDYHRRTHFEYAGAAGGFMDVLGYAFCRGRIFDEQEEDKGQYDTRSEIFWASGACFFVRAEVFRSLKGFDARFFAHMEEIDLCWRMHNQGYTVAYQPASVVYHVGGGTLPAENPFKTYLNFRNNLAMMFKNLPRKYLFPLLFVRLSLDGITGVRFLLQGSVRNLWAILKAHFVFYRWLPYLIGKRSKSFGGFKKLYAGSVVWAYFVKKKKTYTEICSK